MTKMVMIETAILNEMNEIADETMFFGGLMTDVAISRIARAAVKAMREPSEDMVAVLELFGVRIENISYAYAAIARAVLTEGSDWDSLRGTAPDATGETSSEAFVRKMRDEWPG